MSDLLYYTLGYLALSSDALLYAAFIIGFPAAALLMMYVFVRFETPKPRKKDRPQ